MFRAMMLVAALAGAVVAADAVLFALRTTRASAVRDHARTRSQLNV